jgi:hypothetical protein
MEIMGVIKGRLVVGTSFIRGPIRVTSYSMESVEQEDQSQVIIVDLD